MVDGHQAGWSVGTEPALCQTSISALQQVALSVMPYGCSRDLVLQTCAMLSIRLSSGSYFPPPVKRVEIKKRSGGTRPLGVPPVADRIAQAVVKASLEPEEDAALTLPDSAAALTGERMMTKYTGGGRERLPRAEIARPAYHFYATRGRRDSQDGDDWLSAEQERTRHSR
jgi:Protein of unknown function (DUF2934)